MDDIKNKIQFISFAIADAQQLIKNIDTKLAVVNTILGAFIVAFMSKVDKLVSNCSNYCLSFWVIFILFIILIIGCIWLTARILIPTDNPVNNINMGNGNTPKIKFFLAKNEYPKGYTYLFKNINKSKLGTTYNEYSILLNSVSDKDLLDSLTFELLKLSYIRNIKNRRFLYLLKFLALTTIVFLIAFIWFTIQYRQINCPCL